MYRAILALAALALPAMATAQDEQALEWAGQRIDLAQGGANATIETIDGVEALVLTRGLAMLEGVEFSEGVIEFDLAFDEAFGFGGPVWHVAEDGRQEYFYIRQHKSGQPDAGQYTPMRNGLTSWQIFTDRDALAPLGFTYEGWNHFKMVVVGDRADIYFNGSHMPALHIPDLASDSGAGGLGFRASGPQARIAFANLSIRELGPHDVIVGTPSGEREAPGGAITRWSVSDPFPEALVRDQPVLPGLPVSLPGAASLEVEPSGIADISRVAALGDEADTVIVSTRIRSDRARHVRLKFGYSDRVRLFLNGRLMVEGEAGWRSRDHFFLGTIGFHDAVVLPLQEGENVLQAAVSETFGGWGFAGAIAERDGIVILP